MKTILCFGDSNVWGSVASPVATDAPSERRGEHERWPGVMRDALGADVRVVEEGLSGRTTIYSVPEQAFKKGETYLLPCLMSHRPLDLIVFMLGTNDLRLVYHADTAHPEAGMRRLVEIAQGCPDCGTGAKTPPILIVSPILICKPTGRRDYYDARGGDACLPLIRSFAPAYEALAREKGCAFLDAARFGEPDPADGMHLTLESHFALGRAVAEAARKLLAQRN